MKFKEKFKLGFVFRSVEKTFRKDIRLWEDERMLSFSIWAENRSGIPYLDNPYGSNRIILRIDLLRVYAYAIREGATLRRQVKFIKIPYPDYLKKVSLSLPVVGKKEFETVYKGNKWLVPTNLELDLSKP